MKDELNDKPLIVHGESGSGKTSIMAMTVKNAWSTEVHQTIIIRFLGTTPDSSNILSLLLSVINQIRTVYNQQLIKSGLTLKELAAEFENTLELATKDRPLLVVLDSLDQLDVTDGARQLYWFPDTLPKHVKMIVSTLPEPEYECFPKLQSMFDNPDCFLPVSTLSNHDVEGILNKWLATNHRKLQEHQLKSVIDAFHQCPIPLFLKLAFDEACRWKSFTPRDQSVLNTTVRTVINNLFNRIEKLHGELLVSRALGYLTLSSGGLTEAELEDILSCDDDVLNDVYMYWTPPIRRLPPLLFVRIKAELKQYFVDKGADGVRVFYWYHRQFIEAAYDRYCSDEVVQKQMHSVLADYFSGVWANGKKKPYTSKSGESSEADRIIAAQPNKFINKSDQSETFNLRKLNNLPHHRLHADQQELLKSECLCNFDFILNKLKGSGFRSLLDDFFEAKQKYDEDEEIGSICDALQLSQHSLQYNPQELSSQLLGRLKSTAGVEILLEDCKNTPFYYLLPSRSILTQPGGSLQYRLANHTDGISGLDLNKTGAYDNTIKVLSVKSGKLLNSFDIDGQYPSNIKFCNNDETLLVTYVGYALGLQYETGLKLYTIKDTIRNVGICGEKKDIIGVFSGTRVLLHDAATGKIIRAVECEFLKEANESFRSVHLCVGSKRYMAVTVGDIRKMIVFDAETNQFVTNTLDWVHSMIITPDCQHIIVCIEDDLLIYDLTSMKLVREIEGESEDSCKNFQITPDGKTLYFPSENEVIAYDIEEGERYIALHHSTTVKLVITADMNTLVTNNYDGIVHIWNRSKDRNFNKTATNHADIGKCILTDNPRYTTTLSEIDDENDADDADDDDDDDDEGADYLLEVIDLSKDEVLKRDKLKEFCVLSQSRKHLKIIQIETGKIELIPGCGREMKDVIMNKSSKRAVCSITGRKAVLFDLEKKQVLYKLKACMVPGCDKEDNLYIEDNTCLLTGDGQYFIFLQDLVPECVKSISSKTTVPVVWHIESKKAHQILCDEKYIKMYTADSSIEVNYKVVEFKLLDKSTLLVSHNDYIIRIYNFTTGTLLKRLFGHTSRAQIMVNIKSPFFLTFFSWSDENTIRVWDRETYKCLASYCLESGIDSLQFCPDGYRIIVQPEKKYPFYFEVKGGQNDKYTPEKPLHQYEELFHPTGNVRSSQKGPF